MARGTPADHGDKEEILECPVLSRRVSLNLVATARLHSALREHLLQFLVGRVRGGEREDHAHHDREYRSSLQEVHVEVGLGLLHHVRGNVFHKRPIHVVLREHVRLERRVTLAALPQFFPCGVVHLTGDVDGRMGAMTRAAVKKAQLKVGLPADSYPTPELMQRLRGGR